MREVLERAPTLDATAMLVLICIAEHANDETRRSWPGMDVICAETRIGKSDTVQKALRRIRAAGVDLAATTAHHGRRTVYTLPRWAERHPSIVALDETDGRNVIRPSRAERAEPDPRRAEPVPLMGGTSSAPSVRNRQEPEGTAAVAVDEVAFPEQCPRHQYGPNATPCGPCRDARLAQTRTSDRHRQSRSEAHSTRLAVIQDCRDCDDNGLTHDPGPDGRVHRCTHNERKSA